MYISVNDKVDYKSPEFSRQSVYHVSTMRLRLRELRKKRQLTQQELADKIGCTKDQVSKWETGKRNISSYWLEKIAPVLRISPGELLDDSRATDLRESAQLKAFMLWDMVVERTEKLPMEFEGKFFR